MAGRTNTVNELRSVTVRTYGNFERIIDANPVNGDNVQYQASDDSLQFGGAATGPTNCGDPVFCGDGTDVNNGGVGSTTLGPNASTSGGGAAVAVGTASGATGTESTAVGNGAAADGARSTGIGRSADAGGDDSVSVGNSSEADSAFGIAVGALAIANDANSTVLGGNASAGTGGTALGNAAGAASGGLAVGNTAVASGAGIALGNSAQANVTNSIVLGNSATASAADAIVLGRGLTGASAGFFVGGGGTGATQLAIPLAKATVTQLVSNTTGVTLNAAVGRIQMFAVQGGTSASEFLLTNSTIEAGSVIVGSVATTYAAAPNGGCHVSFGPAGAGSVLVRMHNAATAATATAPNVHYRVVYQN